MDNKYRVQLSDKMLLSYYKKLIDSFYAVLCLYEGLDYLTKEVVYEPQEAHEMYLSYVQNLIYELCGAYTFFNESEKFLILLNSLEYMMSIQIDEKYKLKPLVFKCINICKKLERSCGNEVLPSINTNSNDS